MEFDYIEVLEVSFINCIYVKLCYVINWYVIADSSFYAVCPYGYYISTLDKRDKGAIVIKKVS